MSGSPEPDPRPAAAPPHELVVREVDRPTWALGAAVAARAMHGEEFVVGMFGTEPVSRYAAVHHLYRHETWDDSALHLGAFAGPELVGVIRASPFGRCHACAVIDPAVPPDDPVLAADWAFEVQVTRAHAAYAGHAWISRVAVEPALQGAGVGRALVDTAVEQLGARGGGPVLLECLAQRESFYLGRGFRREAEIPDPNAEMSFLMRQDLPPH